MTTDTLNKNISEEDALMLEEIASAMEDFVPERSSLIPILQMVQEKYQYISADAISVISDHLNITSCEIYGVATFYNQFRFNPPGRHRIKVCLGTACHVKGGDIILENFERKLEIKAGETTEDREYSIDKVACVGCCALAPVAIIDEDVHGYIAPSRVEGIILGFEIEREKEEKEKSKEIKDINEN